MISPSILALYELDKNMNIDSFISKARDGRAKLEEIEDYIDFWHNSDSLVDLSSFLGMTKDEYQVWVEDGAKLKEIINK